MKKNVPTPLAEHVFYFYSPTFLEIGCRALLHPIFLQHRGVWFSFLGFLVSGILQARLKTDKAIPYQLLAFRLPCNRQQILKR